MERNYKISIPEPCHENWDEMTPKDNGRFCVSCSKTVVDFTAMLPEEIQQYFISHKNVCGRLKNEQLGKINIQIPSQILYSQIHYHKMFLLALFIAMGTTLFSCQDKDGNKQKIDKVEVVEDVKPEQHATTGIIMVPLEKQKTDQNSQYEQEESQSGRYGIIYNPNDLDIASVPKDGMKKFKSNFSKKLITAKEGELSVLFVIEGDGSLSNFNILKNTTSASEKDIIGILEKTPKWIPGKRKNRIVRSTYTLQIPFK
ncbi:hypothetical protein HNP37_000372 [Flavobacterium nitrogenifigens]|uniref:TonB protein C-terminal n=2 Tax=Flavobacterium TaxID=237 RepID=A0A7W7ITN0_9FLAO|nr:MULTISPECIES: hypothetical protein [Flavobacterium]MBB4800333.1 hypothetical protein [Flavobacterium nitrogenifigens]MBB6385917.1 hypothetical protein [Flavobacterium notoginsengisoli]